VFQIYNISFPNRNGLKAPRCHMKDFKKYFTLPAEPELVYRALTHAPTLQLWTGEPAEMTEEEGTEFSLWSGSICGRNLSFRPGKEIVQEWYFGEQEPPSIVTIRLHAIDKGTSVELRTRTYRMRRMTISYRGGRESISARCRISIGVNSVPEFISLPLSACFPPPERLPAHRPLRIHPHRRVYR